MYKYIVWNAAFTALLYSTSVSGFFVDDPGIVVFKKTPIKKIGSFESPRIPGEGKKNPGSPWKIDRMECEYRINPLGMDEDKPRFSWTFFSNRRDQYQSAYEISVSTSIDELGQGKGESENEPVWHSGKINSGENINIIYAGKELHPLTRYFWKVKCWNQQSESSSWSKISFFETGYLHRAEWKGNWIGAGKPSPLQDEDFYGKIPAPLFRKAFTLNKIVRSARLYISGLGYYEAYLNGRKVGDLALDPGWTNYSKTVLYSVYDITNLLHQGSNAMGIVLGNGWYNPLPLQLFGSFNLRNVLSIGGPKVIADIRIQFTDGGSLVLGTDGTWKTTESDILKNNIYLGEEQDGRLQISGWDSPGLDDASWSPVKLVNPPRGELEAQAAPPIRITKILYPINISNPTSGIYVFDLGQNFAGWIRMKVRGIRGQLLRFRYGELLYPDGRVNGMTTVAGHIKEIWKLKGGPGSPPTAYQEDSYICRGDSVDVFQPHFSFHAFRFVEISGLSQKPDLNSLQGLRLNADLNEGGKFTCSNETLNRIQQNTLYTFLSNVFSVQSDCPGRERQGYGGDMVVSSEAFIYNFDMSCFYAKAIKDFANDVRCNGGMPECAPYNGIAVEGFAEGAGPIGWELAFSFLQEKLYRFYGNRKIIEDNYDLTKRMVGFLGSQSNDNLIDHGIGDHVAVNAKHVPLTSAAFYFHHVKLLQEFAGVLGNSADELNYRMLSDSIAESFNRHFLRTGLGEYDTSYNQTTQVFPLWYELAPGNERAKAFDKLAGDILEKNNGHLSTGIFGTKMLFDVLRRFGRNDLAFQINTQTSFPSYGYMLKNGATTLWESWEKPDQNSLNHPMFGSVSEWFYRALLGINPAEDACGMDRVILQPFTGGGTDLQFVKGYYQSIRGRIISEWEKSENLLNWKVSIPPNMKARIYIPAKNLQSISENGQPIAKRKELSFLILENGNALFDAVSGTYHFSIRD